LSNYFDQLFISVVDKKRFVNKTDAFRSAAILFHFRATVCKTVRPILSDHCLSCLSTCLSVTLVYCGHTVGWIKMKLGTEAGLGPGHIVLDRNPAPLPTRAKQPHFSAHVYRGQTARWIKMPLGMEVGLGSANIVLDGDPVRPPPKKMGTPQFLAYVCCGQTAGWVKMPLGTEVGLGPCDIVLDG